MKLALYCTCGAVLKTTVDRRRKMQTLLVWFDRHEGEGHAPTTAAGAEQARMGTGQPGGREAEKATKQ